MNRSASRERKVCVFFSDYCSSYWRLFDAFGDAIIISRVDWFVERMDAKRIGNGRGRGGCWW